MVRRIGIYVPRDNYLKVLAPLIWHMVTHEAHRFEPVVICPGWSIAKAFLQPVPEEINRLFSGSVSVEQQASEEAFVELFRSKRIDAFVNLTPEVADLSPKTVDAMRAASRKNGIVWMA